MTYILNYSDPAKKNDYPKLGESEKIRIRKVVEEKLTTHPEIFGKPLRCSLKGCRSLRVGSYRVVFRIEGAVVMVYAIQKREKVYKNVFRRII